MKIVLRSTWSLLCLTSCLALSAQWDFTVKNLHRPATNVRLFLGYAGIGDVEKSYQVNIDFRPVDQNRILLHREMQVELASSDTAFWDFDLPVGRYEVEVEVEDRKANQYEFLSLDDPFEVHADRQIDLSDVFISAYAQSRPAFIRPLLQATLPYDQEQLTYSMEIQAPGYDVLTIRAILYQESPSTSGLSTIAYQSLEQTNQVTYFQGNAASIFSDTLNLSTLPGGEYMIQVLIYDDEDFLMEEKTWFIKGGDIKQRIFEDLNTSIGMMKHLISDQEISDLQGNDAYPNVKRLQFMQIWERLYGEEAEQRMEAYFERLYAANNRYAEPNLPGWLSDRGQIFMQYGEPRVKAVQIEGKDYVRWTYARWALSFLFEMHNQTYSLVE